MGSRARDAEWIETRAALVEALRTGRISGREVIEELGISSGILGGWCRAEQVRREAAAKRQPAVSSNPAFAQVKLVGDSASRGRAVILLRGGRRVRVGPGFDAGELQRLVRTLEAC